MTHSGWNMNTAYRFKIYHEPKLDLINVKLWTGSLQIFDTGNIIDTSPKSLRGGRLGVYCFSQENIKWSQLSYK